MQYFEKHGYKSEQGNPVGDFQFKNVSHFNPWALKEKNNVHQPIEDMDIREQDYVPSNVGLGVVVSHHAFH